MSTTETTPQLLALEPGGGEAIWFLRSRMTVKATAADTGGAFGLTEVVVPPGFSPPTHVHHGEIESFYVLEGEVTFRCMDRTFTAEPGSFVVLPRHVPHSFVVEGAGPARMLNFMTPGGGEGFFVDAGRPARGDGLPPAEPVDVPRLRQVGETYAAEIVGPPLTPSSTV